MTAERNWVKLAFAEGQMAEGAQRLIESGMLNDLFAKIDAGEVQLDGVGGFIQQLIKTGLECGLQVELTEHVGYDKGDPEAHLHENRASPDAAASPNRPRE
ncbi:hypothetical protein GCM10009796_00080 [Microbacterium koreense]